MDDLIAQQFPILCLKFSLNEMNSLRKNLAAFNAFIILVSPFFIRCHPCGVCSQENLGQALSSSLSREHRNQAIKNFFMKKMNRSNAESSSLSISSEILENAKIQYERLMKQKNPVVATIIHEIPGIESPPYHIPADRWRFRLQNHTYRYFFHPRRGGSFYPKLEKLVTAKLILQVPAVLRNLTDLDFPSKLRIDVYQIMEFTDSDQRPRRRLVDSHVVPFGTDRAVHFHFHEVVSYWQEHPHRNYGIEVLIDSSQFSRRSPDANIFEDNGGMSALLRLENGFETRRKRNIEGGCRSDEGLCCKFPHRVDFEEIGLHWIVYPKSFFTHQCVGRCPESSIMSLAVNDVAVIRSSLHMLNESIHPAPCCVPTKLSNLTIMYMTDGDSPVLNLYEYPDFIVEECGCA